MSLCVCVYYYLAMGASEAKRKREEERGEERGLGEKRKGEKWMDGWVERLIARVFLLTLWSPMAYLQVRNKQWSSCYLKYSCLSRLHPHPHTNEFAASYAWPEMKWTLFPFLILFYFFSFPLALISLHLPSSPTPHSLLSLSLDAHLPNFFHFTFSRALQLAQGSTWSPDLLLTLLLHTCSYLQSKLLFITLLQWSKYNSTCQAHI